MGESEKNKSTQQKLLLVHCAAAAASYVAAVISPYLGSAPFGGCIFRAATGLCCLTCGATRAAHALAVGDISASLSLNPVPALLAVWLGCEIARNAVCALLKKQPRPSRADLIAPCVIIALAVVYCVLRNLGAAPLPESVIIQ